MNELHLEWTCSEEDMLDTGGTRLEVVEDRLVWVVRMSDLLSVYVQNAGPTCSMSSPLLMTVSGGRSVLSGIVRETVNSSSHVHLSHRLSTHGVQIRAAT